MKMMNQNTGKTKELIKKFLPVSSLILLTFLLMVFFRYKKQDIGRFLEEGKNNLVAFYAQNLQPLFTTTEITNEDVFNFALYNSLPINKQSNKVLTISNQDGGSQTYEIKPSSYNPGTKNYQKFIDYLGLSAGQKNSIDSILNLYKKEIYLSILMNDKNTVAVSPKIGELQKAVLADVLNFARQVNPKKAWDIFPVQQDWDKDMKNFIVSAKEIPQHEFFFITPDTAFKTVCTIDTDELNKAVDKKMKLDVNSRGWAANSSANWDFDFHFSEEKDDVKALDKRNSHMNISVSHPDSNSFKIVIPIPEIPEVPFINDSIKIKLDKAAQKLRNLSVVFNHNEFKKSLERKINNATNGNSEFYFQDPTEIIGKTMEMISKKDLENWDEFGRQMDSLAQTFAAGYSDSALKKNKATAVEYKKSNKSKPKIPSAPKEPVKINQQ